MASIDASLDPAGTDYVDLYQFHRWNCETPIEETMRALREVVQAGKARQIGASSMYAWRFAKAQHTAGAAGWPPGSRRCRTTTTWCAAKRSGK